MKTDYSFPLKLAFLAISFLYYTTLIAQFGTPIDAGNGTVLGVSSMDVGDLNGDGRGDVIITEGGKHASGRKNFAWLEAPTTIQGPWIKHNFGNDNQLRSFLGAAKVADMDNDGDLDLIVSSDNHSGGSRQADLYVYINPGPATVTGNWSFQRVTPNTLALHHINDMEIADMDNDGNKDIVVRSLEPNQIHIFFQNNISSYQQKIINTNIPDSEGLAVGFLDADNFPDITFTGHWLKSPNSPRTQNYLQFDIDPNYKNINQNTKEAIGDIDGDGLNDVIIAPAERFRNGGNTVLAWYKNPGNTTVTNWQQTILLNSTNNTHTVKLGDMDNDGDLDVVTGIPWANNVAAVSINVYYNNGLGVFNTSQQVIAGNGLYSGIIYDIDGDNDLDIIGQNTYARSSRPFVYENQRAALPVELISFDAETNQAKEVVLTWSTAVEINNDYFLIERSQDGFNWETIANIKGVGNTTNTSTYEAIDPFPLNSISYYRLQQTDIDGRFTHSKIVAINTKHEIKSEVNLYPNPTSKQCTISLPFNAGKTSVEVRTMEGKLLQTENISSPQQTITLKGIDHGVYLITIQNNRGTNTKRLIVE